MRNLSIVIICTFLTSCATTSSGKFDLEPYKKMTCEELRETRVQLDIERQKISWPSSGVAIIPIAGWIYYGAKKSYAESQLIDNETKRTAIRSQQHRCPKTDLFF